MKFAEGRSLRPEIMRAIILCLAVAMAPWFTGGQKPMAMLISGLALLLAALLVWRQSAVPRVGSRGLVWSYAALMAWAAASCFWTANTYSTVVWVVVLGLAGLAFKLSYVLAAVDAGREWLIRLYVAISLASTGYGFWLYFTETYDRLTGPFYWPNPMAAYLIPAILLAMDRVGIRGRQRWAWLGLLVILGTAFALTDSRAGTVVLAVVAIGFLVIRRPEIKHWTLLVLGLIGVVTMTFAAVQLRQLTVSDVKATSPGSRFAEAAAGESMSGSDRIYYIKSAVAMWQKNPVLGVGAGAYGDVHPQYQLRVVSASTSAHNFYVQTLAELGIVGVGLLIAGLIVLAWGVWRGLREAAGGSGPLAFGLLGLLMHVGLDIDARYPAIVLLVAVLAGAIYREQPVAWKAMTWRPVVLTAALMAPLISLHLSAGWTDKARVSQDEGEYGLAAEQFAFAHQWPVYNPDVISAEGINHYTVGLLDKTARPSEAALALDRARQAAAEDPADGQHRQLEGRALMMQGDLAGAERALREALRLDPYNHPEYAMDLATALYRLGRPQEAQKIARAMVDQYPQEVVDNRANDATLKPTLAMLWVMLGEQEQREGRLQAAADAAAQALRIDSKNPRALMLTTDLRKTSVSGAR